MRHTASSGRTLHIATILFLARAALADVTWLSPSAGDIYGPADTLVARWTADKDLTSPSFRLCLAKTEDDNGDDDAIESRSDIGGCGSQTWPDVTHSGGASMMSMAVPDVNADHPYYLSMEDDYGTRSRSPTFTLSKTVPPAAAAPTSGVAPENVGEPAQAPLGVTSAPAPVAADTAPTASLPPPVPNSPEVLSSRTPVPTAAFAVPLSIVGAILLIAVILGFRQRSALRRARQRDAEKLARQSSASSCQSSSTLPGDLAKALSMLKQSSRDTDCHSHHQPAMSYGCAIPVPLYAAPVDVMREPRRSTRREYRSPSAERHRTSRDYEPSRTASWLGSQSLSRVSTRDTYRPSSRQVYGGYHSASSRESHRSSSSHRSSGQREYRPSSRSSRDYHPSMDYMMQSGYSRSSFRGFQLRDEPRRFPPSRRSTVRTDASGETAVTESVLADYADYEDGDYDRHARRDRRDRHEHSQPPSCLLPAPQRLHVRSDGPDFLTSPGIEKYLFLDKPLPGRPID
ncbi:hypothetical protein HDZ31DRAFT_61410 [Schizophyllum fasciatum]